MGMQSNTMYITPISQYVYAVVPIRIWWKPWRWNVVVINSLDWNSRTIEDLSYRGALGVLKLYGVVHPSIYK